MSKSGYNRFEFDGTIDQNAPCEIHYFFHLLFGVRSFSEAFRYRKYCDVRNVLSGPFFENNDWSTLLTYVTHSDTPNEIIYDKDGSSRIKIDTLIPESSSVDELFISWMSKYCSAYSQPSVFFTKSRPVRSNSPRIDELILSYPII